MRTTSSHHAPYALGYTRATMEYTIRSYLVKVCKSMKIFLSSDYRLKLVYMKLESLVIAGQLYCGEYVLGPCTHRPSHPGSWLDPKIIDLLFKVELMTEVKS